MKAGLRDIVKELLLQEFFSEKFFRAVMEQKNLAFDSPEKKILGDKMSTRTHTCLWKGISDHIKRQDGSERMPTVSDLLEQSPAELLRIPNFGRKSLNWTEVYLSLFDLYLKGVQSRDSTNLSSKAQKVLRMLK